MKDLLDTSVWVRAALQGDTLPPAMRDNAWCVERLRAVIQPLDWEQARRDVQRFVKAHELPSLEHWSADFFLQQCAKLGA